MPGPFRQTDAVLTIAQDNDRKVIEVTAANEVAGKLVGYASDELAGMAFRDLVPDKIAEMLDDYVEFEAGYNDVGDVLRKVRDFQLKNKNGKYLPFKVKIVRHHSQQHDEYLLILQDQEQQRVKDTIMSALRDTFAGHAALNADTGLPDRTSFEKGLDLVLLHRDTIANGACAAVFELDNYQQMLGKYGIKTCHRAMQEIAALCSQNLRENDVIAQFDQHRLALILVGAGREPAKMVLNRLRWLIAGLPIRSPQGLDVNTTVTVLFRELQSGVKASEILAQFEKAFESKPQDSTNMVVEA